MNTPTVSFLRLTSCLAIFAVLPISLSCGQADTLSPAGKEATQQSKNVIVNISKGRQIEGELAGLDQIAVKTSFGDAKFTTSEIEGIKLNANEDGACIFAFKNGDLVTGKITLENLKIKTDWGEANIRIDSIEMIRINPNGEFYEDTTVEGKQRWRFGVTRELPQAKSVDQNSFENPPALERLK